MKNNRKLHKLIFNLSMVFVLIIGLSLPTPVSQTALAEEEEDDESGFLVEVDKVDGQTDIFDLILDQELNMDEGELTGVTITQESVAADGRTLTVKIHSEGPVPVEYLTGDVEDVVELDPVGGLCTPSQVGWTCFEDVVLLLSYQAAASISLPNSTVEVCFEGECAGVEDVDGMNMDIDDIELEDMDMDGLNELVDTVDEMVDDAQGLQQTIDSEGQVSAIGKQMDEAKDIVGQPDTLSDLASDISGAHETLDEHVTDLGIMTANADDTLKQVSNQVDLYEEKIEQEEEEWSDEWGIEPEEFEAYLEELDTDQVDEEELPDIDISEWKDEIADIQERMADTRGNVDGLTEHRQELTEELDGLYTDARALASAVEEETDGYADDQLDNVLKNLDVAEPGKTVEKQMIQIENDLDTDQSNDEAEQLQNLTEDAVEEIETSGMSVELAEEIGQQTDEINESMQDTLEEADRTMEQHEDKVEGVDSQLSKWSEDLYVPEMLAEEYMINALPQDEQNNFRVTMQDNVDQWEEQLDQLLANMSNQDLLESLQAEHGDLQEAIDELRHYLEDMEDELTEEEFNALMKGLELDDDVLEENEDEEDESSSEEEESETDEETEELEERLDETLHYGNEHAQAIQPILEDAYTETDVMKALAEDLTDRFLGMDALNDEEADDFREHLDALHSQMEMMAEPAHGLQNEIQTAEELQGELETNSEDLENLKDTVAQVEDFKEDLKTVQDNLNALSFTRTNEFIDEIEDMKEEIDNWFN